MSPRAERGDDNYPISEIWDNNRKAIIIGHVAMPRPSDLKAPAKGRCVFTAQPSLRQIVHNDCYARNADGQLCPAFLTLFYIRKEFLF